MYYLTKWEMVFYHFRAKINIFRVKPASVSIWYYCHCPKDSISNMATAGSLITVQGKEQSQHRHLLCLLHQWVSLEFPQLFQLFHCYMGIQTRGNNAFSRFGCAMADALSLL